MNLYEATGTEGFERCELLSRVHALLVLGPRGRAPAARQGEKISERLRAELTREQAAFARGEGPSIALGERRSGWTCRLCEVQEDGDNQQRPEPDRIYRYRQLTELQDELAADDARPQGQRRLSDQLRSEVEAAIVAGTVRERRVLCAEQVRGNPRGRVKRGNRLH